MSEHDHTEAVATQPDLREITAKNISALRTSHKMTQLELGEALSYSDKAISKWERGEAVPDAYVLLDLSRLFGVSVDWLLSPHSEEEALPKDPLGHTRRHNGITLLSFFGVWALATLIFVVLAIVWQAHWQIFVYAIPAALTVLLVFNAIWGQPRRVFLITGALIASVILAVYIATLERNLWQLFILLPPAELLVLLSRYLFRKK